MKLTLKILLGVLAVLTLGYLFLAYQQKTFNIQLPGNKLCCVVDPTAGWKNYSNEKYEFNIKLPPSWEFLDNNPSGNKMDFSFRDKKYNSSYEWPGLRVSSVDYVPEFKNARNAKSFVLPDAENDVIRILFDSDGNKLYASCALYLDKSVIEKCNQILSTFKFY